MFKWNFVPQWLLTKVGIRGARTPSNCYGGCWLKSGNEDIALALSYIFKRVFITKWSWASLILFTREPLGLRFHYQNQTLGTRRKVWKWYSDRIPNPKQIGQASEMCNRPPIEKLWPTSRLDTMFGLKVWLFWLFNLDKLYLGLLIMTISVLDQFHNVVSHYHT